MSLDRYDIRSKIGEGGVGAVYRAFDRNLNREVAIKRVLAEGGYENQEEATEAMLQEATALCSIQHPHIVTVYDAGVDQDGPYVVMELLSGRTVDEMVQRGVLTRDDFRELAVQSQEALIAAQELDLVHRDIKPSNLMVTWLPSGRFHTKLVDFGLAKFSSRPSHQTIDHADAVFGSIRFMAPEQFERTPLDKRTDMYAMGCVYYYCLTGRYPFDGESAPQVMTAHLQHQVTPVSELRPDLPGWLCDWVMWHISRSVDDRPAEARQSLKKFLMSENNPEAGTPEFPQAALPSEAHAPQADSNPPPLEDLTSAIDLETPPQPIQAVSPAPQAPRPKLIIPGQQPAPAAPAPIVQAPVLVQPAPVQPAPVQPVPVQAAPEPLAAPVTEATAPQPVAAPPQLAPTPVANPLVIPPAPAFQAAPVQPVAPAPIPQAAPVQSFAPAPIPQVAPTPAPQITIPLSGSTAIPAAPVQQAAPPANPLLVAAAPAPQAAVAVATSYGIPPQPATPLGATKPGGVGIGSIVPVQKKGMSSAVKGMIITTLVAALIVTGIIWKGISDNNDEIARLNEITSIFQDPDNMPDEVPLSESDVQLLLGELSGAGVKDKLERPAYFQALLRGIATDGVDISAKIAAYAKDVDMSPDLQIKLFNVVGSRGDESALPALIEFATRTDETGPGQAAINAAEKMATISNFESLLAIVTSSSSASIKNSAVDVLSKVVRGSEDPGAYAKGIVSTYQGTPDEDGRIALLRLMGAAGGDEAADIITDSLAGDNAKLKVAAIYALRNWPDHTQFKALFEFASEAQDARLRKEAFAGLIDFLKDGPEMDTDDKSPYWYDLASVATGDNEQRNVIDSMVSQNGGWADDILDYFRESGDSDKVIARAEDAKRAFFNRMKQVKRGRSTESRKEDKKKEEKEDE